MNIWFTGDTHYNHPNIITYCNRPFSSIKEMNKVLIDNYNSKVCDNDLAIFLGDFIFKVKYNEEELIYLRHALKGNLVFIRGNHDNEYSLNTPIKNLVLTINGKDIFCTHRPRDFNNNYSLNLVAHIHNKWKVRRIYNTVLVNVGVDVNDYFPINMGDILSAITDYDNTPHRNNNSFMESE